VKNAIPSKRAAQKQHHIIQQSRLAASPERVWQWITAPSCFQRLLPPWIKLETAQNRLALAEGNRMHFIVEHGVLSGRWTMVIHQIKTGYLLGLQLRRGRKAAWSVWIKCLPGSHSQECILEDRIDVNGVGWGIGRLETELKRMLYYRHRTLKNDIDRLMQMNAAPPLKIVIAGGTGMVGKRLVPFLRLFGHEVTILSTRAQPNLAFWNPASKILDPTILEGTDVVINLGGSPIACRWNRRNRENILLSRVKPTQLLVDTLANKVTRRPAVWIQASGVGYYGYHDPMQVTEQSRQGTGFLAAVCQQWEEAAIPVQDLGIRMVPIRLGVVLTPEGGALGKMLPWFRLGLGGRLGNGKQHFPWISVNDLNHLILHILLQPSISGPINACVPQPPSNREFTRALGTALHRPAHLPAPAFALRAALGTMAKEALLGGAEVLPVRALETGFEFQDASIDETLRMILGRW
jgi:uncharacterized protein